MKRKNTISEEQLNERLSKKGPIKQVLFELGFDIDLDDDLLVAEMTLTAGGTFQIRIDLLDSRFSLSFYRGCASVNLLFAQGYESADNLKELVMTNRVFSECALDTKNWYGFSFKTYRKARKLRFGRKSPDSTPV